jgi:hypothetical protein
VGLVNASFRFFFPGIRSGGKGIRVQGQIDGLPQRKGFLRQKTGSSQRKDC